MSVALETSQFPIHCACRDGDVVALVSMLQQLADPSHLSAEDTSYGWTPIHWAAHYGQLECVVRLVQMGCEVNSVTSRFNQTPTHTAAFGGHTDCVVWLTQAGADVNSQDFVGEAPIHKAARSGSVEVIQVLLIAGAKAHLRNASGQTAADLAHANGYHDCYRLVSKAQKLGNGIQGNGLHGNGEAVNVNGRKRLLTAMDGGYVKKARSDMNDNELVQSSGGEEQESMNTESTQETHSDNYTNGHHQPVPYLTNHTNPDPPKSLSPPPALTNQNTAQQRPLSETCGSLHLNSSPSSCVSHRPSWWASTDCGGDFLHFGHYHGFGDTAEDMGAHVEHSYKQALSGSAWHLYH